MEFRYQLTIRPVCSYTTPDGEGQKFLHEDNLPFYVKNGRCHGQVSYTKPLSVKDIERYSLLPIDSALELKDKLLIHNATGNKWVVRVDESCFISLFNQEDEEDEDDTMDIRYTELIEHISNNRFSIIS